VNELRRRAQHCRRLADGAVPLKVVEELAALAHAYESEAIRLERERHAA
jgi:hypothetical protein